MTETPPTRRDQAAADASGRRRDDRLKAALKANMARRKAQAKARDADRSDPEEDRQTEKE